MNLILINNRWESISIREIYDKVTKQHECQIEYVDVSKSNTNVIKSNTNEDESNTNEDKSNTNDVVGDTKRQRNQQSVLAFCREAEHTADEIFEHLGISRQAKHYDTYIQQLVLDGQLLNVTPERKRGKKYRTNYANE